MPIDDEVLDLTTCIGRNVRRIRNHRGWRGDDLVERLRAVGVDIKRDALFDLEKGKRASVSVDLLIQLAYVLDVSPLVLMLPPDDQTMAVTPTLNVPAKTVYEWAVGGQPAPTGDPVTDVARYGAQAALLRQLPYAVAHHQSRRLDVGNLDTEGISQLLAAITEVSAKNAGRNEP